MGTNSRQNQKAGKAFDQFAKKIGDTLIYAQSTFERMEERGDDIVSIRIRFPDEDSDDYLATVKMTTENGNVVGFHGGGTFHEVLVGVINRLGNGTMKWKDDQYA